MNEEELKKFLEFLAKHQAERTPESARRELIEEGILDEQGELTEFYR